MMLTLIVVGDVSEWWNDRVGNTWLCYTYQYLVAAIPQQTSVEIPQFPITDLLMPASFMLSRKV